MLTLQKLRQAYRPRIPHLFEDFKRVHLMQEEELPIRPEIQALFPDLSSFVVKGSCGGERSFHPLAVGVVLSGGQAAGGHNVISGLFDMLKKMHSDSSLWGFLEGPKGIVEGVYKELTAEIIEPYRNQGGFDIIGSGRTKIETEEQFAAALKTVTALKLDGLVIVGGDDSNTNAALLAAYFLKKGCKTAVVGVPKTIDGDLKNSHVATSFGFDTATKTYSELIGNIARDAQSAKKYTHFIKLMGRSASHVALECALKTHPNLTLISEEKKTLQENVQIIADVVMKRAEAGKNYGVILIPEGLAEFMPNVTTELDPHGNLNVSAIETEKVLISKVKEELKQRSFKGKFSPIAHFFGYEGRAALPSNFDTNYCYTLGMVAALLIDYKQTGYMCFVGRLREPPEKWTIGGIPLASLLHQESRKGEKKPVIAKALVDLQGPSYLHFKKESKRWVIEDDYHYLGPIQFCGDPELTDTFPLTL